MLFPPLKPYTWKLDEGNLLEIPVTTMPLIRAPIHASYVLYLASYSTSVAKLYFRLALGLCRVCRVEPSILLHPLDFLGADDGQGLEFFPAMQSPSSDKMALMGWIVDALAQRYRLVTMREHAAAHDGKPLAAAPRRSERSAVSR